MPLLPSLPVPDHQARLMAGPVYLRHPVQEDFEAWAGLRGESRAHLEPWEPSWPSDDLTKQAFRRRIRRYQREIRQDESYPFLIFSTEGDRLLGGCTLSGVRRGVSQCGFLGYWIGERFTGQGFMTAAVRRVVVYAFDHLRLQRVQAACVPDNTASRAVLERCGFQYEGVARGYLKINGIWKDHAIYALLADDSRP